jgi:hypothetical protein
MKDVPVHRSIMKIGISALSLLLLAVILIAGCKKNRHSTDCFKLKAVYLYQGSNTACASNIWEVEETPDVEIQPGTYVTFVTDQDDYPANIKIGDVIYIKLKMKVMSVPRHRSLLPIPVFLSSSGRFLQIALLLVTVGHM